ncbi:molybdopterin-dependent oxidoreductase [Caballeronia sp. ATUFL_M2_KS44]|uniref:molybdopterin-dependent oxidoreductase n=1 Tax=Caballeronia sp. ATUFL_M2_KS44 TaxID=2921767 RepID=UPI00202880B2|nr:molybdopterin-dependent oxidoreductase [Caballeronia sp. ATUFL_M2_KS44]
MMAKRDPVSRVRLIFAAALLCIGTASCGGHDASAPPSKAVLSVSGEVSAPVSFSVADLQALPSGTQTVSFASGNGAQTHTYTGANVWTLLNRVGIATNPAVHNDVLSKYVIATGADNYRSLFAMGELSPDFGNRGNEVAYAETINGASAALPVADGPLRITAPGDIKGGRYVSNLVRLDVRTVVSTATASGGGPSTQLRISGAVAKPATYDLAALEQLPAITRTVGTSTYTGVSLWSLLNAAGIQTNAGIKNDILGFYAVATGSDGYRVVISLAEISPDFGNQPDMVAYAANGAPLAANGFARLVIPGDAKAGRYVSNLIAIEVVSPPR